MVSFHVYGSSAPELFSASLRANRDNNIPIYLHHAHEICYAPSHGIQYYSIVKYLTRQKYKNSRVYNIL
jgi:hypothetical protein